MASSSLCHQSGPSKVPVLDIGSKQLQLVATSKLNPADYFTVTIPKYRREFDIYVSQDPDMKDPFAAIWNTDDIEPGSRLMCRLKYGHVGGFWCRGVKRMLGKKYRVIWIRDLPQDMQ